MSTEVLPEKVEAYVGYVVMEADGQLELATLPTKDMAYDAMQIILTRYKTSQGPWYLSGELLVKETLCLKLHTFWTLEQVEEEFNNTNEG